MGRPVGGYFNKAGDRIPGISTVASIGEDESGLRWWYHDQGRRGVPYEKLTEKATNVGNLAHDMVECWIKKVNWVRPAWANDDQVSMAAVAYSAFMRWAEDSRLEITHTELTLVSEKYQVGGTLDAAAKTKGRRSMLDWKTSNDTYPAHLVQVKGYGMVWDEHFPDDPITDGYHVIRFGKEFGNFSHHWWPELDAAGRAFLLKRELYGLQRVLKSMAK